MKNSEITKICDELKKCGKDADFCIAASEHCKSLQDDECCGAEFFLANSCGREDGEPDEE